jgi:glycosyltransferase involved in cell wall biosynthesis
LLLRLPFVRGYDGVIIHREIFPLGPPLVEQWVTRRHGRVWFDLDDAMWHAPSNPVYQRALLFHDPQRVARIMAGCTRVIAGNAYIRQYALQFNENVTVIPTSFDDLAPPPAPENSPPVVVWIGNLGNASYLAPIVATLERVCHEHPFTLRLIGGEDIASIESSRLRIERLAWNRDREAAWLLESDVGIMPLPSNEFEQGKCAFKLIQYFSAGLPAVASPVAMNVEVIDDGVNGYLAGSLDEWGRCLLALLRDPERRRRMGAAARATYQAHFTRRTAAERWLEVLRPGGTQGPRPPSEADPPRPDPVGASR